MTLVDWCKQFAVTYHPQLAKGGEENFLRGLEKVFEQTISLKDPEGEEINFVVIENSSYLVDLEPKLKKWSYPPLLIQDCPDHFYLQAQKWGYRYFLVRGSANTYLLSDNPGFVSRYPFISEHRRILEQAKELFSSKRYSDVIKLFGSEANRYPPSVQVEVEKILLSCYQARSQCGVLLWYEKLAASPFLSSSEQQEILNKVQKFIPVLPTEYTIELHPEMPPGFMPSSPGMDKERIIIRGVNYSIANKGTYHIRHPRNIVQTRNFFYHLDTHKIGAELLPISSYHRDSHIQGLEDVRLFGDRQFLCTCVDVNERRIPQVCYGEYDDLGRTTVFHPLSIEEENKVVQCEKNWLPFIQQGAINFIYSINPLQIYLLNPWNGNCVLRYGRDSQACYSGLRGSAPPIEWYQGFLLTVHQVEYLTSGRNYYHRFVWFNFDFTKMRVSEIFNFGTIGIEYTLGMRKTAEGILISHSENDNRSFVSLVLESTIEMLIDRGTVWDLY